MVLLEFSMYPMDKGKSVSPYVARSLEIIDSSGLDYECHAMGTILEGEFDEVLDVMKRCFEAMASDCERIECTANFDYRKDRQQCLKSKVASVEEKLGHPVRKQNSEPALGK